MTEQLLRDPKFQRYQEACELVNHLEREKQHAEEELWQAIDELEAARRDLVKVAPNRDPF